MLIEKLIRDELDALISEAVYCEEPAEEQASYVVIEKTNGGEEERHLGTAMISAFCYSDTLEHAAELCESVKEAFEAIEEHDSICQITLNSDYNYTDTSRRKYRYRALFDVIFYK